jgi:hypothetical protein
MVDLDILAGVFPKYVCCRPRSTIIYPAFPGPFIHQATLYTQILRSSACVLDSERKQDRFNHARERATRETEESHTSAIRETAPAYNLRLSRYIVYCRIHLLLYAFS